MANPMLTSRILVVDDNAANVRLMARILATAGYTTVKGITDPREALDVRREWKPDLVLLDLHMPHIDGISLLHTLRAHTAEAELLPVLVLTADASRETLKGALSAGANDYVTKPFDVDEVLLRVRNLLAIRHSHESLKNSNVALATALRQRMQSEERQAEEHRDRLDAVHTLIERGPTMVFQPIVELATNRCVGVEALARFEPDTSPERWFDEATALGLGTELELAAVRAALALVPKLGRDQFMTVNVSPSVMLERSLHELIRDRGAEHVVIEISEHRPVESYDALNVVRARLRREGIKIAVDDTGAGYASLHHILKLGPDIIKLDIGLTRDIDCDPVKRALTTSLVQFARETGAIVTAEGVETASELATLRSLDVAWGQGFHLGRPQALVSDATSLTRVG